MFMILAFLWSLAEATFFFIIPDVIITFIALHSFKAGLQASLIAVLGALIGGSYMYFLASKNYTSAYRIVERVPAISKKMIREVKNDIKKRGLMAMVFGVIYGIPYKIYAIMAPKYKISYVTFILVSIPARFARFFLTSTAAWFMADILLENFPMWIKYVAWAIIWTVVYSIYWTIRPFKGTSSNR